MKALGYIGAFLGGAIAGTALVGLSGECDSGRQSAGRATWRRCDIGCYIGAVL